ncbi:MAG TPA: ABC transporter ATP-binding protein [Fimbriimonadaceae bacterium]|nr:ABC transporter ATP-binding protein [Fimbriimonadaceae bacterium]
MNWLKRRIDERIWSEIGRQKATIIKGLVCSGGSAALLGLTTWLIKFTLGAVKNGNAELLTWLSGGVILIFGFRYFFTRGQLYFLGKATSRLTSDLRIRLFEKLQRLPVTYFNEKRAGGVQSVLTNDVNVYTSAIASIRDAIDGPIKIVVGFVAILTIQWKLSLVSLGIIPFMVIFIQHNARKMKTAQANVQRNLGDMTAMMQEQLQGTRIVKAFGAERTVVDRFRQHVEDTYAAQLQAVKRIASLRPSVELIGAVALAVTVYICGVLVKRGELSVEDLGAFIYALDVINQGFKNVGSLNQTLAQVQAATDRIYEEVLDAPETIGDAPNARTIENPVGRIEFKNVSFAYPDGTKALSNVSFVIEPGTSLALVGPSGAGKSTIADLMLRFYDPTEGQVLYDGVDIRELKGQWYRSQIGVVPQQTFLFAGTISDNLRLGKPDASENEIVAAAKAAHADVFIQTTEQEYETVMGERGIRLSGGEGQRIAIARALVRKPNVLLLDEATSNLDAHSERIVTNALTEIMQTRTTLFIAHRLTTAARATNVLVLRKGETLEYGTHDALVAKGGVYAGMYKAFTSGVLDELG